MQVNLLPGDVFCCSGNMFAVSALIRLAERVVSMDDDAHYGHAGIITSAQGDNLETGWTVRDGHLDEYQGQQVLIARPHSIQGQPLRPILMSAKQAAIAAIAATDLGRWYPVWRLPMHLVPPLAKYLGTGHNLVCSERVAKYLQMIGARQWPYTGVNPDTLADEWATWSNYNVIYEGVWEI